MSLTDQRALVTGASAGIGRSIALALASAGCRVVVSARGVEGLQTLAAEIAAAGGTCQVETCDVTRSDQVERLAQAVQASLGGIDILIHSAGASESHKFIGHPDELWDRMLSTNLTSAYYVTKAFAPGMVERGYGRIILVASSAARVGAKYVAAYTAAKHGVLGLTRALAVELGPNVTVNAICPGYTNTPMTDRSVKHIVARTGRTAENVRRILASANPQGRLIEPAEVAAVALFLAEVSSRSITGQAVQVDGGAVMV